MNATDVAVVVNEVKALRREVEANRFELREDLGEIKKQTSATNGRVSKLELDRAWMRGALAVIALGLPFLTAVLVKVVTG